MSFYRFEDFEARYLTPHLSTARAPVIEGRYLYLCLVHKEAGTGSEPHYHPNELLIFPLRGKINAVVGTDRRIVGPGTFVHVPAYARHSVKATEDGHCQYLYVKDKTWTVVGLAEHEAVPERAMTVEEANRRYQVGAGEQHRGAPGRSRAIVDGLDVCFYPIIESLDAPRRSARHVNWIEGERLAFGFFEVPKGYDEPEVAFEREAFFYVLAGELRARARGRSKSLGPGDIVHVLSGATCRMRVESPFARYVQVCSTPWLERRIDRMSPEQAERARLHTKPD